MLGYEHDPSSSDATGSKLQAFESVQPDEGTKQFNSAELLITGKVALGLKELGPAKFRFKLYNELPSTNIKVITSPTIAPSVEGVAVSSPQTATDC